MHGPPPEGERKGTNGHRASRVRSEPDSGKELGHGHHGPGETVLCIWEEGNGKYGTPAAEGWNRNLNAGPDLMLPAPSPAPSPLPCSVFALHQTCRD